MSIDQWLGLFTGISFGFLLQKGRVLRFDKQVGAMLLKDMTIFKFMLSAILVGMVGILLLADLELITLSHKSMNVGGVVLGGALFGLGWAIVGFCPGTAVGALGEGRWHAIFAILGMIAGAMLYAELYPLLKPTLLGWKDFGKIGLPEATGVSQWLLVLLFAVIVVVLFSWFEKKNLKIILVEES
jgi:uncharacterized membrane protein YedE/YeeE